MGCCDRGASLRRWFMTVDSANPRDIALASLVEGFDMMLADTPKCVTDQDRYLLGPARMTCDRAHEKLGWGTSADNWHYPLGTGQLLSMGLAGIAETAATNAAKFDGRQAAYLRAIAYCYGEARAYVADWASVADKAGRADLAATCRALVDGPPQTLAQAAQLLWLALPIRNTVLSSTLGRLDQHLCPFLTTDLAAGTITRQAAQELIDELVLKINDIWTGEGLMTMAVAGRDADGTDRTNPLSEMFVDAAIRLHQVNPQVCVRLHANTPEAFRQKVAQLQLAPANQCTILNDEAIIPILTNAGLPEDLAANYCCDGCNEIVFDGESTIHFHSVEAVKSLELTLFNGQDCPTLDGGPVISGNLFAGDGEHETAGGTTRGHASGDITQMTSFQQVFEAFMDQYLFQVTKVIEQLHEQHDDGQTNKAIPPFLAGTFPESLATGIDPVDGGVRRQVIMLFSCSIATAADGLAAIKRVVFDDRAATLAELLDALRADWIGHDALRKRCLAAPKFGNDDPYVDDLVVEIADRFADSVTSYPTPFRDGLWPALFCFRFNVFAMIAGATPDGRKRGEPIAEHLSPVPGRASSGPTAVIHSQARAPLHKMVGTAVTHISLSRSALGSGDQAIATIRSLTQAALDLGLMVINLPVYDVEQMKRAQEHPEQYADLIVRVWGFSERFVNLDKRLQDHIIARAAHNAAG